MLHADLSEILAIEKASFPAPWSRGMLEQLLELGQSLCFVFEEADVILAYVFARVVVDELHILNMAVCPRRRRQGCGLALLRFILNYGKRYARWAYLEVRTANLAAIRLYSKLGFRIIRRQSRYYDDGSDAYEMSLVIQDWRQDERKSGSNPDPT